MDWADGNRVRWIVSIPQFKSCPRCQTAAPLNAGFCGQCGRQYRTTFPAATPDSNTSVPVSRRSPVGRLVVFLAVIAILAGAGTVLLLRGHGMAARPVSRAQSTASIPTSSAADGRTGTTAVSTTGSAPANPAGSTPAGTQPPPTGTQDPATSGTHLPVLNGSQPPPSGRTQVPAVSDAQVPASPGSQVSPPAGTETSAASGGAGVAPSSAIPVGNDPGISSNRSTPEKGHDGAANAPRAEPKHETFRANYSVHFRNVRRSQEIPLVTNQGQRVQDSAPDGHQFLICEITVSNHSEQPNRITPGSVALIGSDSQLYEAEIIRFFRARPVEFHILDQTVPVGGTVSGTVVFMVPRKVKPARIGVLAF